jgi:formiminoglutamate deiminase
MSAIVIQADYTWLGDGFAAGVQIAVGGDGRIEAVGSLGRAVTHLLKHTALLPGFISAHSHAFQRGLRGQGERFPAAAGTFWTWRESMYQLAGSLGPDTFRWLSRRAFREMRDAGITAVGEFHYLHHDRETDHRFDEILVHAAREAGIRLVLLQTFYATGGIGKPLEGAQRRFATPSLEQYWRQMDRLAGMLDAATQTLGVAAHSVRAVGLDQIGALHQEAVRRNLPFHMHVEEQRAEIAECLAVYGQTPMFLVNEMLHSSGNLCAVHCTHTASGDMRQFLQSGGSVCLCPLTEANLGDGLPQLRGLAGARLSLGTDSNARISMVEEMRLLEYGQRLREERRGALAGPTGRVATTALAAATLGGALALKLPAGRIEPGYWADLVAVDLSAPSLADLSTDALLEGLVFGAGNEVISGTFVGGRWRATEGGGALEPALSEAKDR